jgi:hypothetical protein
MVDSKFGSSWGWWCSNKPPKSNGVRLWKNIRRGWRMFSSHIRFEVGVPRLNFGMTCGVGIRLSMKLFQIYTIIVSVKDASVAVHLELIGGYLQWNVSFIRAANDLEVYVSASFFKLLYSLRVRRGGVGKLCWVPSKRTLFDVKSFYCVLVRKDGPPFPFFYLINK